MIEFVTNRIHRRLARPDIRADARVSARLWNQHSILLSVDLLGE